MEKRVGKLAKTRRLSKQFSTTTKEFPVKPNFESKLLTFWHFDISMWLSNSEQLYIRNLFSERTLFNLSCFMSFSITLLYGLVFQPRSSLVSYRVSDCWRTFSDCKNYAFPNYPIPCVRKCH